jgi:molybdopterin molybdotransferase
VHEREHGEVDERGDRANPEAGGARLDHGEYNIAMISVRDGQNQILAQISEPTPPELLPVTRARERVLAEDLRAPFDVPPTDNSAVDGYAVASGDVPATGTRDLDVVAELPAGAVYDGLLASGQAVRIMTGAPMPCGADTVYPQEVVEHCGSRVRVGPTQKSANVRMRGEDIQVGTIVIERGTVLRPQELGLIASLGRWQVLVHRRPRVALLSTGDEVVEPGTPRKAGQIYDANRFTLRGSIEQCGGEVLDLGIVPDVRDELRVRLLEAADVGDIVVTSGGVSVGVLDLVKEVLHEIGAIDFWQVAMQPGRPLAFGRIKSAHFFGLPGNPVASMLAFMLFVRPAIFKLAGRRRLFPDTAEATAVEPMSKRKGRREFKRGIVQWRNGRWEARITGPQGSGILSSMAAGNCLIVLEEDRGDVAAGETVLVEPF